MNKLIRIVSSVSILGFLTACGGGGSGVPATAPSAPLDGTVTDAVITNGTLRVYQFDDGKQGDLIAETVTDGQGDFEISDFTSQDRPVVIEVSGGRYTEEASGVSVDLLGGQVLRAYLFYEQGSAITLQITPFTHLASCLADYKISTGTNVNNAITEATSVFSGIAGVDILGTKPLDITDPNNANFEVTDKLRYGAVLAAISSYTAEVSETNGVTPHRFNQNSSIYATQVMCQDIAADGVFNGLGFINNGNSVGQLSLGSVALDVDTLRTKIAQHILSIIGSDRNQTSLGVDQFVLYANEISSSTDAVFGGVPSTAVDQEGPAVTAVLAPDSFLKGIVNLDFSVTDPIGVKSVQFNVNDVLHSNGQVDAPVMSLNSTNYTDGMVTITVVATDVLNNVSSIDFNYVIDNSSPTIDLTSSLLTNNKSYTASGTYEEQGASVASIQVNGVDASVEAIAQTWSADITLSSGNNIVTLEITDVAANTNTVETNVGVDLITPTVASNPTQTTFTTFQGQLNLCSAGLFDDTSAEDNPVCVSTDNVSLNGTAISGSLQNLGYLMVSFQLEDPQGAGVFTSSNDLVVEYSYSIEGVEKISWSPVPVPPGGTTYYLPIVTEYLGSDWYQVTNNKKHSVVIRVTDNAGNSKSLAWVFKTDILVPEIVFNSVIDDSLFAASTYASRTGLDGSEITTTYSFENSSNNSILISLTDSQLHSVKHIHETGIRENNVRLVTTEESQFNFDDNGWITTATVYDGDFNLIPNINNTSYGDFQTVFTDDPLAPSSSEFENVDHAIICNYKYRSYDFDRRRFTFFDRPGHILDSNDYPTNAAGWITNGFSQPTNCADSAVKSLAWKKRNFYGYQNKEGYPKNNITPVVTNYNFNTDDLTVVNSTLGQIILPVGGWYKVPAKSSITISKKVRLPVLDHFYDSELANLGDFSSYSEKRLDKATTWNIDTDLIITRVIDPGNIQDVNNVTSSISSTGLGIYQKTISR